MDKKYELNENYRDLVSAVIEQACRDYANALRAYKLDEEKSINPKATSSYRFLMDPDNPYCKILEIDGVSLAHKIEKNFKLYGKGIPTDVEWDNIRKFGNIKKGLKNG